MAQELSFRAGHETVRVRATTLDRAISWVFPSWGRDRLVARAQSAAFVAVAGGYQGGRVGKRSMSGFNPQGNSADADLLPDLATLRQRARDLVRNTPLAGGALETVTLNVVGTGLMLKPNPDRAKLGWTEEQATAWSQAVQSEWRPWCESTVCDVTRTQTFYGLQDLMFCSAFENGDSFALLPYRPLTSSAYQLAIQLIEADRVSNKDKARDTAQLAGGVQMDAYGAPTAYHVQNQHPGDRLGGAPTWTVYPAFGAKTGRRNVLHLYRKRRIGQTRGAPWFSGVIELFKQLGTYTEAEVSAAVLAAMIAITTKTEDRAGLSPLESAVSGTTPVSGTADTAKGDGWDGALTPGLAVDIGVNDSVEAFKSEGRPNPQFDPFVTALLRQAGAYLGLPYEVLIKHFTSSYSAARAALLEAWRFYRARRSWLVEMFCQPVFEAWLEEAVAMGRISAPGFFADPALRAAYCRANWHGDGPGSIDPLKEAKAAEIRLAIPLTTLEKEVAELDGGDAMEMLEKRGREKAKAKSLGLEPEPKPAAAAPDEEEGEEEEDDKVSEALFAHAERIVARSAK